MTKPDDKIIEECRQLCAEYLAGPWSDLSDNEFEVKIVVGGMSNRIYSCLNLKLVGKGDSKFPAKVVIRKYGSEFAGEKATRAENEVKAVIAAILDLKGLGPKVYGIFDGGRIEEFIEHRSLLSAGKIDVKILQIIMKKLADIHHLDMPISKNPEAMLGPASENLEDAVKEKILSSDKLDSNDRAVLEFVFNFDIPGELDWIRERIPFIRSPVVFSHNDLHLCNILERLDRESLEERILILDLEGCTYGFRGYDLAYFFAIKRLMATMLGVPAEDLDQSESQENRILLQTYLERYTEIHGDEVDPEIDNLEHLELEVDFFTVVMRCNLTSGLRPKLSEDSGQLLNVMKNFPTFFQEKRLKVQEKYELLKQN